MRLRSSPEAEVVLREGISAGTPAWVADEGRRYSALDVPCNPGCGAVTGDRCSGPVFCGIRMQQAADLAREGQLVSLGPAKVVVECANCKPDASGRKLACSNPSHRCARRDRTGQPCQWAAEPGSPRCKSHFAVQVKPGRKPVLTDAQVAEAMRRHEAGEKWQQIADSMGVSLSNIQSRVAKKRAASEG
jgi:hypothetical protein